MNKNLLKLHWIALAMLFVAVVFETPGIAQNRGFLQSSPRKNGQLNLVENAGPWLIMCAAFDGEDGRQQAINLANELRTTNGLNAYVYRQHFDFAKGIADRGMGYQKPTSGGASNLRQRKMELVNNNQKTEYAVLVGDYKDIESAAAQKDLAKIKKLQPETLKFFSGSVDDTPQAGERLRANSEAMFGSAAGMKRVTTSAARSKFPLRLAILVTNPLAPEEAGIDQYIMSLNQGLKYSLLENPKPYTLKIATFTAKQVRTGKKDSGLVEAAKRAKILTEYFRSQKVEAYQFHDRYSSYVCIGGFDWVREGDGPDARGNPEVTALAKLFTAKQVGGGQVTTYRLPAKLLEAGVTCDANPLTVAVPKAQVSKLRKAGIPTLRR